MIANKILIISSTSAIAQALIQELSQDPQNQLFLHRRPTTDAAKITGDNIHHLTPLDLMNPVYESGEQKYHSEDAYSQWFQYVVNTCQPDILVVATGGQYGYDIKTTAAVNAHIPIKCCEYFVSWHAQSASQRIPSLIFMNSVASEYTTESPSTYPYAKNLVSKLLQLIHKKYKCSVIDIKIGAVDTKMFRNAIQSKQYPPFTRIMLLISNIAKISPEATAKSIARYVKVNAKPDYISTYVPQRWLLINATWRLGRIALYAFCIKFMRQILDMTYADCILIGLAICTGALYLYNKISYRFHKSFSIVYQITLMMIIFKIFGYIIR